MNGRSPGRSSTRLVLFSGLPGVGKSSLAYRLARETGWAVLAKDAIDQALKEVGATCPRGTGYEVMFGLAGLNLSNGVPVIFDAVFPMQGFRQRAADLAACHSAVFHAVVCYCSDRELWRRRMSDRPEMVPGWTPADWTEVARVEGYYEPWTLPHLALDAAAPFERNVAQLLADIVACG